MASDGRHTNKQLFHHQVWSACFCPRKILANIERPEAVKVDQGIYFHLPPPPPRRNFIFMEKFTSSLSRTKSLTLCVFHSEENCYFVLPPSKNLCLVRIHVSCSKAITYINLIYVNVIYNARCLYSYFCFAMKIVPFIMSFLI